MNLHECYLALGLAESATPEEATARWRTLRAELHPDRGGNEHDFAAAREAYDRIIAHLRQPRPCPVCDGLGKTHTQRGWTTVTLPCKACGGSGRLTPNGGRHA